MLPRTMRELAELLDACKAKKLVREESFVLYVDDGSLDGTWQVLEQRHAEDPHCRAIRFATNAGHQNAVLAGMLTARDWGVDCIISLDADLQDDPAVIPEMLGQYAAGNEIVYGVRCDRSSDTRLKRGTAHFFYGLMRRLKTPLIPDHADYRLVGRRVLDALTAFPERDVFLRGLFPSMGFQNSRVYYTRRVRTAGKSKYHFWKMVCFAWKGITACSPLPLRLSAFMGLLCMLAALAYSGVSLVKYLEGETIPGWTSLIIVTLVLGAVQLFSLALLGEYVAKIFSEVKRRPRYLVDRLL